MLRVTYICPLSLDRLTGTPIRIRTTIKAGLPFCESTVIAREGSMPDAMVRLTGKKGIFGFTRQALAFTKLARPQVIHVFTTLAMIPAILYKLRHPSVRVVFEMHGWSWFETSGFLPLWKRLLFWKIDVLGMWMADEIIAMSYTQKAFLSRYIPWKREAITVLWGPVDFLASAGRESSEECVVGYVGNSEPWQGIDTIIAAARALEDTPGIRFALAGFAYEDEKRFPRLKNVRYTGPIPYEQVAAFMRECTVMVSSRLKHPVSDLQFPHKLSTYLASACPVIVSGSSDQPQVVRGAACGEVVDPLTAETLAEAIKRFAAYSPEQLLAMREGARRFAEQHLHLHPFAERLRKVYHLA